MLKKYRLLPLRQPPAEWFEGLLAIPLTTEREVEARFASPLFQALGYRPEQEVIGLRLDIYEGVNVKHPEADLVYFSDENHDQRAGNVLVLVECKAPGRPIQDAIGQAHSYSLWLKPVYYVVTNGNDLEAYAFRVGPIPDSRVVRTTRQRLPTDFMEVKRFLGHDSALETKSAMVASAGS